MMVSGLVLVLTGYFLSNRFKKKQQESTTFLPATFISKLGIILYLLLLMKIAGIVLVITSIMLRFS
jgi:hypothetical protein